MAGTLRKRLDKGPDAWELRVYVGRDARGRPRQRSKLFRGTEREARRALTLLAAEEIRSPTPAATEASRSWGPSTTINDAVEAWQLNGWQDLSPTTRRNYDRVWRHYVRESIGARKIAALTPYDVETYFRRLKDEGKSAATLRFVRALLHRSCRLARKWSGNQLHNPVTDAELPAFGLDERPEPVRAPSGDEVRALLAAAGSMDVWLSALLRLVAVTGVRRGEAAALRWCDVEFATGVVTVDKSIVSARGGAVVKSPKTRASIRRLSVDEGTLDAMAKLRHHQTGVVTDCGVTLADDAYVFAPEPPYRLPPHPDSFSHAFARVRRAAGVASDVHLHSLRHFSATELDAVISERQKQARLGWSTVHMARHYTDAVASEDRRAAAHMGAVVDGVAELREGSDTAD